MSVIANITSKSAVNIGANNLLHAHAQPRMCGKQESHIFSSGNGIFVRDTRGKVYIDGISGLWCVGLGYGNPELIEAARNQLTKLAYCTTFNEKTSDVAVELAYRLSALTNHRLDHVFFTNSGSEANETALKLIWFIRNSENQPAKKKAIVFDHAYHGATVGASGLTALPHVHTGFDVAFDGIVRVPTYSSRFFSENILSDEEGGSILLNEIERVILREGPETIAAFFAEPVIGAGGIIPPPPGFFPRLQQILQRYDIFFVADEVITGFCRTGQMFGSEVVGISPDFMTVAKNLSSGYVPIGAVLITSEIYERLVLAGNKTGPLGIGLTYSGHPVACAVALACLRIYEENGFLKHIQTIGALLHRELRQFENHPNVYEIRSCGLLSGIELLTTEGSNRAKELAQDLKKAASKKGLIIRAVGSTIAFCPPFICTQADIIEIVKRFKFAFEETMRA